MELLSLLPLYLFALSSLGDAVNVVVFLPGTQRFERRGLERIAQYLALKNHGVITFKAMIIPEQRQLVMHKLHLVEELAIRDTVSKKLYDHVLEAGSVYPWKKGYDAWEYQIPLWKAYADSCEKIIDSDLISRLKKNKMEVAVVYAENPCHLAIIDSLNIPFIYYDTRGFSDDTAIASGTGLYPGTTPLSLFSYKVAKTSLKQQIEKLANAVITYLPYAPINGLKSISPRHKYLDGPINNVVQDSSPNAKSFDVNIIKRSAAVYFVNADPLLEPHSKAIPTNVVYVGGAHMEYPRPLFAPWNESIALARDGVIVVSFGEFANASAMPRPLVTGLLNAFRTLPTYRVFWRIGSSALPGFKKKDLPKNVNFTQFLPQTDLLGNKNARLLISHGGTDSMMEALHLGVPVLGIPLFGSNLDMLRKMEDRGMAKIVLKEDLTDTVVLQAIRDTLQNRYRNRAKQLSKMVKERPVDSFETAIHWIEAVARNPTIFASRQVTPVWKLFLVDLVSSELGCLALVCAALSLIWLQSLTFGILQKLLFGKRAVSRSDQEYKNGYVPVGKD